MKTIHSQSYIELLANLRRERIAKNISQINLSKQLHKPQSYISKIECGERRLDIIELFTLCSLLEIRLKDVAPQEFIALL